MLYPQLSGQNFLGMPCPQFVTPPLPKRLLTAETAPPGKSRGRAKGANDASHEFRYGFCRAWRLAGANRKGGRRAPISNPELAKFIRGMPKSEYLVHLEGTLEAHVKRHGKGRIDNPGRGITESCLIAAQASTRLRSMAARTSGVTPSTSRA